MSFDARKEITARVPKHWKVRRIKEITEVLPSNVDKLAIDGQQPVLLCNYVDVYKNEHITSSIEFMKATATPSQIERLSLAVGDVVITKDSETPWDIAVPTVISEHIPNLVCGYHLSKISPIDGLSHGPYVAWALRSKPVNIQFALSAQGITRYGLGSSSISDGWLPTPPVEEQRSIASYLDSETRRIDDLIQAKIEEIERLRELRLATINDAVLGLIEIPTTSQPN